MSMIDKGEKYVANWPRAIAAQVGVSVAAVIYAVTGSTAVYQEGQVIPEVAALTPDQAREVIARLRRSPAAEARRCGRRHGVDGEIWD